MTGAVVEKSSAVLPGLSLIYTPGVLGGRANVALHHVDSVYDFMGICHMQDDAEIMVSFVLCNQQKCVIYSGFILTISFDLQNKELCCRVLSLCLWLCRCIYFSPSSWSSPHWRLISMAAEARGDQQSAMMLSGQTFITFQNERYYLLLSGTK